MYLQVLSEDEARRAVASAVRLQAGIKRFDSDPSSPLYIPPFVTVQLCDSVHTDNIATAVTGEHSLDGVEVSQASSSTMSSDPQQLSTSALPVLSSLPTATAEAAATVAVPVKSPRLRLSYWALDTALSAVFKGPNPRLGRPSARTKVRTWPLS